MKDTDVILEHTDRWALVMNGRRPNPLLEPDRFYQSRQAAREAKWKLPPELQKITKVHEARIIVLWDPRRAP